MKQEQIHNYCKITSRWSSVDMSINKLFVSTNSTQFLPLVYWDRLL